MDRDTKKKFILIGVCVLIIIAIFARRLIFREGEADHEPPAGEEVRTQERITIAEAMRLASYLAYDRAGREQLYKETGGDFSEWYLPYQNAVITAGYLQAPPTDPLDSLDCETFRNLLAGIAQNNGYQYETLIEDLPERLKNANAGDEVLLVDFLNVYELLIAEAKQDQPPISKQEFFLLAAKETGESGVRLYTEQGKTYYAGDFMDYTKLDASPQITKREPAEVKDYRNRSIKAVVCGDEIVYVAEILEEDTVLQNSWVVKGENKQLEVFVNGVSSVLSSDKALSEKMEGLIADLTISNGKVVHITAKPEAVNGKVLMIEEDEIEIEGFGKLPLHEAFRIYKIYDELEMEPANGILVGYTITDFVISDGVICAALIKESLKAENIRVLIHTSGFRSLFHEEVTFTVDGPFTIETGKKSLKYKAGEEITVTAKDKLLKNKRIKIVPDSEKSRISLLHVKRSYGTPSYRGTMEITAAGGGLTVMNELSLEEYLYSVIPSEMPTSYGLEALKVQAVCARSYAYNQLVANQYGKYGAHVDDSVNSQVYNNVEENEASILAVKETYGKVLSYGNKVVSAFYFSTSCGFTANVEDVWEGSAPIDYFTGKLQVDRQTKAVMAEGNGKKESADDMVNSLALSDEDAFRSFIEKNTISILKEDSTAEQEVATYDSDFPWYRWSARISTENLSRTVNAAISARYQANPDLILTKQEDGSYQKKPVESVGMIEKIKVTKRGRSGIIKELVITGSKRTVKVCYQTNIRTLFAPLYDAIYQQNGNPVSGMTLLPSAFFAVDPVLEGGETTAFLFRGGGYGHGVGMSQNGVKTMVKQGNTYDEIIKHYYNGTKIRFLYQ